MVNNMQGYQADNLPSHPFSKKNFAPDQESLKVCSGPSRLVQFAPLKNPTLLAALILEI